MGFSLHLTARSSNLPRAFALRGKSWLLSNQQSPQHSAVHSKALGSDMACIVR